MKYTVIVFLILGLVSAKDLYASEYVLPYPSYMPGHMMYVARQFIEKIQQYWYFGDMAKVKYHMKMADKYLVETKTLVEYNQVKLAIEALQQSDTHFTLAVLYERDVTYDKKDNGEQKQSLREAGEKHEQIIRSLLENLPEEIEWNEEKKEPEILSIDMLFNQSSIIRKYANR